jgi:uncharacterized protein (TIGR03437 family)
MYRSIIAGFVVSAVSVCAQLIPAGQAVPRTVKPPVVFLNGYESDCGNASFKSAFGIADQALQANGQVSLFFNYCTLPGQPTIEDMGTAFGAFLSGLRYEDGQPLDLVDGVAHSMGGLIVRSYLSGKGTAAGVFNPPAVTHIRKIVFLATPHFGTGVNSGLPFSNAQLDELTSGSRFLFDLATWNQGTDDLRGVDAIAVIGNGGTGNATTDGFDDGVVALTSASLGFYLPGRTRVVPFCHVDGGGIISFSGYCGFNALGIAVFRSTTQDPARIIISFLNGTSDWQNIGVAAEQNQLLSANGGLYVTLRSADDTSLRTDSISAASASGKTKTLNLPSHDVAYTDMFPSGPLMFTAVAGSVHLSQPLMLAPGTVAPIVIKTGPSISRAFSAASSVFPLIIAPGMIVSIYGNLLAAGTESTTSAALPLQLSDSQVMLGGTPIPMYYASPSHINVVFPDNASGLARLGVHNTSGTHTINVLVESAAPSVFTQDSSGIGAAAVLKASNSTLVTPDNPVRGGDYLELFLTGLGATTPLNGLEYANQRPTVQISGQNCLVTYAGRAPGYPGLDQINCVVPSGLSSDDAAALIVTSGIRGSNIVTVAVRQ